MAKKKTVKTERPGFKDLVTLASAGWTPGQVNELLDRFDSLGDLNVPKEPEEDDEDIDIEDIDSEESDEDEDDNVSDEDAEDEEKDSSDDTKDKKKDINKSNSLEIENTRLKKQIQKLQKANRKKDISGGEDEKPIEKSLIDTFQSIFD